MEVAEVDAETATIQNGAATLKNGNAVQQVVLEDCDDTGDDAVVATVKIAAKKPNAADLEEECEEVVEIIEGDEDGDTVEVTETIQVVKQEVDSAPTTTTTVTVVKQQAAADGANGAEQQQSTGTTTTTTTTVVRRTSNASVAPDTETTAKTQTTTTTRTATQDEAHEPTVQTARVTKTIITTTPPTPTNEEKKVVAIAADTKQQVSAASTAEEEISGDEEEEIEEEEEEEEDVENVADTVTVTKTNASISTPTQKQEPAAATAVAANVAVTQQQQKQDNLNNTLKEIISDIDRDIEQQEDVAKLKAQQQELLRQQQVLAQQIRQQQLLAQQLAAENKLQQQQLQQQQQQQQQPSYQQSAPVQPKPQPQTQQQLPAADPAQGHVSKSTTFEESQNEAGYSRKNESYEIEEKDGQRTTRLTKSTVQQSHTSGGTPAVSSGIQATKPAFYDSMPGPSPTAAYQQQWNNSSSHTEESSNISKRIDLQKIFTPATDVDEILPKNRKLYASSAFYSPSLHPTVEDQVELARRISHSLSDISNQQSKGQSMYVNRKKRSVKWVHEGSGKDYHQYQPRPPTSPSILPAYSDAGKHRVQLNMHQEQLLEKYAKPGLKVVKTPWEAALETGSASSAFVEEHKLSPYSNQPTPTISPAPAPQYLDNRAPSPYPGVGTGGDVSVTDSRYEYRPQAQQQQHKLPQSQYQPPKSSAYNSQRDLAYKPNIAQGWKAPSMTLPKELYVPKEIPLESYAPPPAAVTSLYSNRPMATTGSGQSWSPAPYMSASSPASNQQQYQSYPQPQSSFPLSTPSVGGFCASGTAYAPPKQPHLASNSYQTVPQTTSQVPPVNFNPSPLPYDKLAKFENTSPLEASSSPVYSPYRPLAVPGAGSKVRNVSPAPYGARPSSAGSRSFPPPLSPQIGAISPNSGTPGTSRPPSQQCSSYGPPCYANGSAPSSRQSGANLSNCQNFNNAARGWGGACGSFGADYRNTKPMAVAANLPYTDF